MEINKKIIILITLSTFILLLILDFINISQFIDYSSHMDSTISNLITFISILIGFISAIYVMIQQSQDSYVLKLLREQDLLNTFNTSFKTLMYVGFINVLILIILNFFIDKISIFKYIAYLACPLTTYFLLVSNNIITTICKMISSKEKLKKLNRKVSSDDIKYRVEDNS